MTVGNERIGDPLKDVQTNWQKVKKQAKHLGESHKLQRKTLPKSNMVLLVCPELSSCKFVDLPVSATGLGVYYLWISLYLLAWLEDRTNFNDCLWIKGLTYHN